MFVYSYSSENYWLQIPLNDLASKVMAISVVATPTFLLLAASVPSTLSMIDFLSTEL